MIVLLVGVLFAGTALPCSACPPGADAARGPLVVLLRVTAPQGVSLDYTAQQMREIEGLIQPLRDSGEVVGTFAIAGQNGQNNCGFMVLSLAPWDERERSQQEIVARHHRHRRGRCPASASSRCSRTRSASAAPARACSSRIVGSNFEALGAAANELVAEMEKDPRFRQARVSYDATQPQLFIASTASGPPTSASTSTASARRCRRCSTAARSARSSSTTAATT